MPTRLIQCCLLVTFMGIRPAYSQDVNSRIKSFCNDKVRLTENSITFSVKQIVTLGAGQKSTAALDSVSAVEISMMHLNCNLFVAQMITQQEFLDKQTEILQFALDLESLRALAEVQAGKQTVTVASNKTDTNTSDTSPSSAVVKGGAGSGSNNSGKTGANSGTGSGSNNSGKTGANSGTGNSSNNSGKTGANSGTGNGSNSSGKVGTASQGESKGGNSQAATQKNSSDSVIKSIAIDLGITLKNSTGVAQSGNTDLVGAGISRLIHTYSPIPVSR